MKPDLWTRVSQNRPWKWREAALAGLILGLVGGLVVHGGWLLATANFHAVVPGLVYRSAQLSPVRLEQTLRRYGIRTVVNLRGICDPFDWYLDECRTAHRADASLEDIGMSAGRLPPTDEIRYLLRVLDRSDYPILIHCRQGVDRTGLISAMVLLLYTDTDLETARKQLTMEYGHLPLGRMKYMRQFLDLYENWLQAEGQGHSCAKFRRWLEKEYCPGACRAKLEALDAPAMIPLGQPWSVRIRAHNTSVQPWHFRAGSSAGIHAIYVLSDANGQGQYLGRAGLFNTTVPPGESIDLTLTMPAIHKPGPCYLMLDMIEEQQCWFYQTGSEPLMREFVVGR